MLIQKRMACTVLFIAVGAAACGENSGVTPPDPQFAKGGVQPTCVGTATTFDAVKTAARDYWPGNLKNDFLALLSDIGTVEAAAFKGLQAIAASVDLEEAVGVFAQFGGEGGSPAEGATLAQELIKCGFNVAGSQDLLAALKASLEPGGAFAVRNLTGVPDVIVSSRWGVGPGRADDPADKEPIWLTAPKEESCTITGNPAVVVSCDWAHPFGADPRLVYGEPLEKVGLTEESAGALFGFEFNNFPDMPFEPGNNMIVATCDADDTPGGGPTGNKVQRDNGVLTSADGTAYCASIQRDDPQPGGDLSLLSRLQRLAARLVSPEALHAGAVSRPGGLAGLASGFSEFFDAFVPQVDLLFLTEPCGDTSVDEAIPISGDAPLCAGGNVLKIRAQTAVRGALGGNPIEEITVMVNAIKNNAVNTVITCGGGDCIEDTGSDGADSGIATFGSPIIISSEGNNPTSAAGGYRLEATADGFLPAVSQSFTVAPKP